MKNVLLVINVLLLAAVGYLYYYNFSAKPNIKASANNETVHVKDTFAAKASIAYIELDSLNKHIVYIKDRRKELEAEQTAIENEWQNGYKRLQAQRDNFIKKGASSPAEMEQMQNTLIQQQQQIDGAKQSKSQKLNEKSFTFMDDIQKKLKEFLADYNKDKKFTFILTAGSGLDYMLYKDTTLNITKYVIDGMNEKMKPTAKK
ncbi:MAG: OmpH family outer membrane protein [Chitinophagaceae bacterium]|nr:OmpH family outer membrane protein [Chitinophagaceae bacterium]